MAHVSIGDVSPSAPRSSLEALAAGPEAYGHATPLVLRLAASSVAKRPASREALVARTATPVLPTQGALTLAPNEAHACDGPSQADEAR